MDSTGIILPIKLSQAIIKVIKKILYSPRIKQKELAEDVGASVSTVQRIIKKLVKEEKIVRMNGKRNGYWKVL